MNEKLRLQAENLLQADEHAYRACILYETLRGKPIEETYKNIKKVMPTLDYLGFEYWYYRFLNGKLDLNHDKSTDPKIRGLLDMPLDVVENIVENLDPFSLLSLRKVSRSLRSAVDRKRTLFGSVRLDFRRSATRLVISKEKLKSDADQLVQYISAGPFSSGIEVKNFVKNKKIMRPQVPGNHRELASKDLSTLLKNPNWTFKSLHIECNRTATWPENIKTMLSTSKVRVEELRIDSVTLIPVVALLPCFNSAVLKSIWFETKRFDMKWCKNMIKLDQWKNAEELYFNILPDKFDIRNLFHTKQFFVFNCCLNEERLVAIRDVLLKSATVKRCRLWGNTSLDASTTLTSEQVKNVLSQDPAFNNEN